MKGISPWFAIIAAIVFISINGLLASAEIALVGLNKAKLKQESEKGDTKSKHLLDMKNKPSDFLSAIQIGITLAGLLSGAFAADTLADPIIGWIADLGVNEAWLPFLNIVCIFLITFILTYFMMVFGELVPKRIAMTHLH